MRRVLVLSIVLGVLAVAAPARADTTYTTLVRFGCRVDAIASGTIQFQTADGVTDPWSWGCNQGQHFGPIAFQTSSIPTKWRLTFSATELSTGKTANCDQSRKQFPYNARCRVGATSAHFYIAAPTG